MRLTREYRSLLAGLLCLGILVSGLLCAHNHGVHSGLSLALGVEVWCVTGDGGALPHSGDLSDSGEVTQPFSCPLCSVVTLALALLLCIGWRLRRAQRAVLPREGPGRTHPRQAWPALNPRAP